MMKERSIAVFCIESASFGRVAAGFILRFIWGSGVSPTSILHDRLEGEEMKNRDVACHLHCLPSMIC